MPELIRLFGLRFFFFSDDHDPIHVHVAKGRGSVGVRAKFTLFPVELVSNSGLSAGELKIAREVIEENKDLFAQRWNEYFNNRER